VLGQQQQEFHPLLEDLQFRFKGIGNCVEVGRGGRVVVVRDTKDRAGAVLAFGADAWARFAATVRDAGKA
jgi:Domain of unknown function (DUF397)